jgi:hypothetical protein
MRVGVIGGCIARERIESNKLGGIYYIYRVAAATRRIHTFFSFPSKDFFDKSTFWMYEIPSWNINGAVCRWSRCISVCCIRHFLNSIVVRFLFTFGCTSQSAKWQQLYNPFSSSFSYYHLNSSWEVNEYVWAMMMVLHGRANRKTKSIRRRRGQLSITTSVDWLDHSKMVRALFDSVWIFHFPYISPPSHHPVWKCFNLWWFEGTTTESNVYY